MIFHINDVINFIDNNYYLVYNIINERLFENKILSFKRK